MPLRSRRGDQTRRMSLGQGLADKEANDRRLVQCIEYLEQETIAEDTLPKYVDRVWKIDEFILKKYPQEGYLYDRRLLNELQDRVRQAKSEMGHPEGDDGELDREAGLFKLMEVETEVETEDTETEERAAPPDSLFDTPGWVLGNHPPTQPARLPELKPGKPAEKAIVREKQFAYGGPNNEVEEWHKEFPPTLPFGETLRMQKLESLMIQYDLDESKKRMGKKDADPIVKTNVKYADSELPRKYAFESGSRFHLTRPNKEVMKALEKNQKKVIEEAVLSFNQGGPDKKTQIEKDYAPRIFLDQIDASNIDYDYREDDFYEGSASVPKGSASAGSRGSSKTTSAGSRRPSQTSPPQVVKRATPKKSSTTTKTPTRTGPSLVGPYQLPADPTKPKTPIRLPPPKRAAGKTPRQTTKPLQRRETIHSAASASASLPASSKPRPKRKLAEPDARYTQSPPAKKNKVAFTSSRAAAAAADGEEEEELDDDEIITPVSPVAGHTRYAYKRAGPLKTGGRAAAGKKAASPAKKKAASPAKKKTAKKKKAAVAPPTPPSPPPTPKPKGRPKQVGQKTETKSAAAAAAAKPKGKVVKKAAGRPSKVAKKTVAPKRKAVAVVVEGRKGSGSGSGLAGPVTEALAAAKGREFGRSMTRSGGRFRGVKGTGTGK
ncbi:hypothetical protein EJ04DRAFT_583174 [Polyplosphaeria fusca]|uniref:Uncharacterized protein n=1 Tax=Polyplosphaeria fusca TaxID=682080 RepID=A0A9P4R9H4_9PLEO|nr:hypothetical protein EJ04DRAFT_583174 [Polyplosphaeria fusca]